MIKTFAPQYERDALGRILFPKQDAKLRRELFSQRAVSEHPGKNNLYLVEALVDYLTEPGDTVLDPMAGVGSILIAARMGRTVVAIELEQLYVDVMFEAVEKWVAEESFRTVALNTLILNGDCRVLLPMRCDHVIFSPPFASSIKNLKADEDVWYKDKRLGNVTAFHNSPLNLSLLNPFQFKEAMKRVFNLLFESIKPAGYMAVITRDTAQEKERQLLSDAMNRVAHGAGFRLMEWYKRAIMLSARATTNISRGGGFIDDEDILIYQREA